MKDQEKTKDQLIGELVQLRRRITELETSQSEHQQVEKAFARHQEMLQRIIDQSHTHLVYLDPDFNFVAVNTAYARTCHRNPDELLGRNHFHFYPHPENEAIFRRVRETGEPVSFVDKPFVFPDQPERGVTYWDWTLSPVKDASNRVEGLVFSLIETTERKNAEEALRASEERFRLFMDNSPAIAWMKDEQGRYVYLSKTCEEQYGVCSEDWLGKTDADLWPASIAEAFRKSDLAVLSEGQPIQVIEESINPDGSRSYRLCCKFPFHDSAGNPLVAGIGTDITDRRRMEEELRRAHDGLEAAVRERTAELAATNAALAKEVAEHKQTLTSLRDNEEKYRRLFENELFAVCIFDLETLRILDVNDTHVKLYGYSREELLGGMVATDLSAELEASLNSIRRIRSRGTEHVPLRYHKKRDGTAFPVEIVGGPYVHQGRRVMYGIVHDISKRLQMEETLRHSEEKYRALVESTSDCIWETDSQGCFTYLSPKFEDLLGYDPVDFIGRSPAELIPDSEAREVVGCLMAAADAKHPFFLVEHHNRHRDGRLVAVEVRGVPFFNTDGKCKGMRGITRDVTARKQAEEMMRLHLAVMETVAEGIFLIGAEDNLIKWTNRKLEQMFGYDRGEMVGMHVDRVNAPTDQSPTEIRVSIVSRIMEIGEWHGEIENIRKDGTRFWCHALVSLFDHPQFGTVFVAAHTDITERRRAEKALRESEALLHQVLESTLDAVFAIDRDYRLLINNQRHQQVLSASGGHPFRPRENVLSLNYPRKVRSFWRAAYDRALRGEGFKLETEWTDMQGHPHVFENCLSPLRGVSGSIIGALIVSHDITERHRTDAEIKEKSEHLTEVNAALRALLRQRDTDRKEFEESVTSNLKYLVLPYLESLKRSQLTSNQLNWVEILETHLEQVTSTFARKLTLAELHLSNAELRVASLVRDGKSTKEIAKILMASEKTVSSHRDNIRKKLGLRGKKGGLRYLLNGLC